jgi:hypothetical protein
MIIGGGTISGACFDEGRNHRYALWRIWDNTVKPLLFIGLNPSTASEHKDDPTIIRLVNFAKSWHYGGLYAGNLYSIVSPDPKVLVMPISPFDTDQNDIALQAMSKTCSTILVGWGEWGKRLGKRPDEVLEIIGGRAFCLKINKSGEPVHPLYQPSDSKLMLYDRKIKG